MDKIILKQRDFITTDVHFVDNTGTMHVLKQTYIKPMNVKLLLVDNTFSILSGYTNRTELLIGLGYREFLNDAIYYNHLNQCLYRIKDATPICLN